MSTLFIAVLQLDIKGFLTEFKIMVVCLFLEFERMSLQLKLLCLILNELAYYFGWKRRCDVVIGLIGWNVIFHH